MESLAFGIERWEGKKTNKQHMKQMMEKRRSHQLLKQPTKNTLKRRAPTTDNTGSQDGGARWESFYKQQKNNTMLPTFGNMLRTMDGSSYQQKLRRRHLVGNKKYGVVSHRQVVAAELARPTSATEGPNSKSQRPPRARAA